MDAIVLDFDGVILDTETALIDAYEDVHRMHQVAFDDSALRHETGLATFSFDPWARFPSSLHRDTLEAQRRAAAEARFARLNPMPGVEDLISRARQRGLPLAIASNSTRAHVETHLRRLGLLEAFAAIAVRGEGHRPKPEPDLYRHAVNALRANPARTLAIEDSRTGVLAAKAAGLFVLAVPTSATASHDFTTAHLQRSTLADLDFDAIVQAMASHA
jgi:putative hydrolase of the HAD superfamily